MSNIEIMDIIKGHYEDLKTQLAIERVTRETTVFYNNQKRIEYLEKVIKAYEELFPHICS